MKKNQIGFFNVNEVKCKAASEKEDKDEHDEKEQISVPPHVINEIEEHVLAKQEYEKSMQTLYKFQQALRVAALIVTLILCGIIFYGGYKYGQEKTLERMNEIKDSYNKGCLDTQLKFLNNQIYKDK